jgi:hypothetical protein
VTEAKHDSYMLVCVKLPLHLCTVVSSADNSNTIVNINVEVVTT